MGLPTYKVVNLTGHAIKDAMSGVTYPAEVDKVARCSYTPVEVAKTEDGGAIYEFQYNSISGLPAPKEDTKYIVSAPVLNAALLELRDDCIAVHSVIRDRKGVVQACKGFRENG